MANEAMNSGCALVADHMIGAVPYLVRHGENGLVYGDGRKEQLFGAAERLVRDRALCRELGEAAYRTIVEVWNAESAAGRGSIYCAPVNFTAQPDCGPPARHFPRDTTVNPGGLQYILTIAKICQAARLTSESPGDIAAKFIAREHTSPALSGGTAPAAPKLP